VKNLIIFAVGLVAGMAVMLACRWRVDFDRTKGEQAVASADRGGDERPGVRPASALRTSVVALGALEPKEGIVNVASPLAGHRIETIAAQPGVQFKPGDLLVQLDAAVDRVDLQLVEVQLADARQRQVAEIERAQQALSAARLSLTQLEESRDLELALQEARGAVLAAKTRQAEADLLRLRRLRELTDPLVSDQQVEQQSVLLDVARSEQQAAEIGVKKLNQSLDFQLQTAEAELQAAQRGLSLAQAGGGIRTLEQQKQLAEIKLQQTRILAPIGGTVLDVLAHPGEVVTQSPLLQIADLENLVCQAEVDATDLQRLTIGQQARVSSRAFRGPFPATAVDGVIERFGSLVSRAALQPLDPRKPVDRHVVQVLVAVDAKEVRQRVFGDEAHGPTALVGLQVEVRFPEPSAGADPLPPEERSSD